MNKRLKISAGLGLIMLASGGIAAACPDMQSKTHMDKSLLTEASHANTEGNKPQTSPPVSPGLPDTAVKFESIVKEAVSKTAPAETAHACFDMDTLVERLKKTDAIGFFTKLAIRNDVVDFSELIQKYRQESKLEARIKDIRARFEGLFLKIVALLEKDPNLSRDIYLARENIWKDLLKEKV